MRSRLNNNLADWITGIVTKPDGTRLTLRQVEAKTGIPYSTVKALLDGRNVSPETIIRFAEAFHVSIPEGLRLAGFEDIAEIWETGAAPQQAQDDPQQDAEPQDESEGEVLLYYRGVPDHMKPAALKILKSLMDDDSEDIPTIGKGKNAR
jgi:transcriptional regulator with XRE-family HTH domain